MRTIVGELVDKSKYALPRLMPREQTVFAERHRLDLGRAGERGEDELGGLGDGARRVRPCRAGREIGLGRDATQIMDDQLVAGLLQVRRHARNPSCPTR